MRRRWKSKLGNLTEIRRTRSRDAKTRVGRVSFDSFVFSFLCGEQEKFSKALAMANKKALEKTTGSLFETWTPNESSKLDETGQIAEIVSKRMSGVAVAAFAVSILALTSFVHVGFVCIAVLAILLALAAVMAIASSGGELAGKKIARFALVLGIACAIGGPYKNYVYRADFESQADRFFNYWIDVALKGDITELSTLGSPYWSRPPITGEKDKVSYWIRLKGVDDEEPHHRMHSLMSNTVLLTLSKLGEQGVKASFYKTSKTVLTGDTEETSRIYAFTTIPKDEHDKKQTFFVTLAARRNYSKTPEGEKRVGWSVLTSEWDVMKLNPDGTPLENGD